MACPLFSNKMIQTSLKTSACSSDAPIIYITVVLLVIDVEQMKITPKRIIFHNTPYNLLHRTQVQAIPMLFYCHPSHTERELLRANLIKKNIRNSAKGR